MTTEKVFHVDDKYVLKLPEAIYLYLYCFYHGLSLYAFILPLATARGKIFGISANPW
jgi:hypothetical protein